MQDFTLEQSFAIAVRQHQAGQLTEAEKAYLQILSVHPEHAQAKHLLGVIAFQKGHYATAVELIRAAIELNPNWADAQNNLGNALRENGQLDAAIKAYERAVELSPNYADAHYNLANALRAGGWLDNAIASYRRAAALTPNFAKTYQRLGHTLVAVNQLDEATLAFRKAVALAPNLPESQFELANALQEKGDFNGAIAAYQQAIALKPDYSEAYNNLGNALDAKGLIVDSIAAYQHAIRLKPDYAQAFSNLGGALMMNAQLDAAIASFSRAIELQPDFPEAHNNLANALKETGQIDDAIAEFRRAFALNQGYVEAHSNLVLSLEYSAHSTSAEIAKEQQRWNAMHAEPLKEFIQPVTLDVLPDRRLKIGYVSADFKDHVVGRNILPLFLNHDHQKFEIFCYSQVVQPTAMTQKFQQAADVWRNVIGISDEQLAQQNRGDKIDILVDLGLHTAGNRLLTFARKPASVQVTFAGYPSSTGLTMIDYRLSDPYIDPMGMDESFYTEKTIRLSNSFWCYEPGEGRDLSVGPLPILTSGMTTFGCLNHFCKVNDYTLAMWAKVLQKVERSRLILLTQNGKHRARTMDKFSQEGIDPARIEFMDRMSRRRYLQLYHKIDLCLDTFPYNGHSTGLDALWMGVPFVTLIGDRPVSRAGWCHLSNMGCPELAGNTPEKFINIAVKLAADTRRLQSYRQTLRSRMLQSPLMNAAGFAQDIESAYRQMWDARCKTVAAPNVNDS